MIQVILESNLTGKTVLDFGCHLGGFLKLLYDSYPFERGIGVDIRTDFIKQAQLRVGSYPVEYYLSSELDKFSGEIDVAFSHEVIHLVPSIESHAQQMRAVLKVGASYYVARSFHAPEVWRKHKAGLERQGLTPLDLTPESVVKAFEEADFDPSVRLLPFNWFTQCGEKDTEDYDGIMNMIEHYSRHKLLFRFTKRS